MMSMRDPLMLVLVAVPITPQAHEVVRRATCAFTDSVHFPLVRSYPPTAMAEAQETLATYPRLALTPPAPAPLPPGQSDADDHTDAPDDDPADRETLLWVTGEERGSALAPAWRPPSPASGVALGSERPVPLSLATYLRVLCPETLCPLTPSAVESLCAACDPLLITALVRPPADRCATPHAVRSFCAPILERVPPWGVITTWMVPDAGQEAATGGGA